MEKTYDCVILAAGDYPTHSVPLSILKHAPFIVCCDGAADTLLAHSITPQAIVGDGDSLSHDVKERCADRLHIVHEQEYNDLTKATRFAIAHGYRRIAYLGCTGRREDHTIGNISLMTFYQDEFQVSPTLYTDHGIFTPSHGTHAFPSFPRQQVSIFNINATALTSIGLRWDAYPYTQLWQGTLNEALADTFTLYSNGSYIVFQTYEEKH